MYGIFRKLFWEQGGAPATAVADPPGAEEVGEAAVNELFDAETLEKARNDIDVLIKGKKKKKGDDDDDDTDLALAPEEDPDLETETGAETKGKKKGDDEDEDDDDEEGTFEKSFAQLVGQEPEPEDGTSDLAKALAAGDPDDPGDPGADYVVDAGPVLMALGKALDDFDARIKRIEKAVGPLAEVNALVKAVAPLVADTHKTIDDLEKARGQVPQPREAQIYLLNKGMDNQRELNPREIAGALQKGIAAGEIDPLAAVAFDRGELTVPIAQLEKFLQ